MEIITRLLTATSLGLVATFILGHMPDYFLSLPFGYQVSLFHAALTATLLSLVPPLIVAAYELPEWLSKRLHVGKVTEQGKP